MPDSPEKKLLRSFVAGIEAMYQGNSAFGPFSNNGRGLNFEVYWPNLAILLEEAKTLLLKD